MKKPLGNILIAVVVMAALDFVFWKIGWITSWAEIGLLYGILAAVIAVDLAAHAIRKKWKKRKE